MTAEGQRGEWWIYTANGRTRHNMTLADGTGGTWEQPTDKAREFFVAGLTVTTPGRWRRAWLAWKGQKRKEPTPPPPRANGHYREVFEGKSSGYTIRERLNPADDQETRP